MPRSDLGSLAAKRKTERERADDVQCSILGRAYGAGTEREERGDERREKTVFTLDWTTRNGFRARAKNRRETRMRACIRGARP